ncbi:MbnP family protein [Emticicia agri]|uniref:Copper-binding protein MbnP-like domain-containing protein n=1 Tax=Emticicia agri TaxID=2492393 RepID=A0A4Q5LYA6_9BACT|nr:MbnP family protein [Emticicia agri]RYU94513.1 hypothetical protein EWM59_16260 [Emticicia agri]
MKKILLMLLCAISVANAQKTGSLSIRFDHFLGNEPLILNDKKYKNATGDEFNVSLFQYFVSNIKLIRKDGSTYDIPQDKSYFLIRESNKDSKTITLTDIPKGKFTGTSFLIGIDSTRSTSEIGYRKGCLDVGGDAKDMYWAWNSGYIFVKMEGTSPQSTAKNNMFMYHIGLFGGIGNKKTLNNIRYATIDFGKETLRIKDSKNIPQITIKADASKILNGETNIEIAKNPTVMGGPFSAKIAENYKTMFSFVGLGTLVANADKDKNALGMNQEQK